MERLNDSEAWLDLDLGDEGIVRARLESASNDGLVLTYPDWSQLYVECTCGDQLKRAVGHKIEITVRRTEDGVEAVEVHVRFATLIKD